MPNNKDRSERVAIVKKSHEKTYAKRYTLQIRRDSGMAEPIEAAANEQGITPVQYILNATLKQLITDGYMTESTDTEE